MLHPCKFFFDYWDANMDKTLVRLFVIHSQQRDFKKEKKKKTKGNKPSQLENRFKFILLKSIWERITLKCSSHEATLVKKVFFFCLNMWYYKKWKVESNPLVPFGLKQVNVRMFSFQICHHLNSREIYFRDGAQGLTCRCTFPHLSKDKKDHWCGRHWVFISAISLAE